MHAVCGRSGRSFGHHNELGHGVRLGASTEKAVKYFLSIFPRRVGQLRHRPRRKAEQELGSHAAPRVSVEGGIEPVGVRVALIPVQPGRLARDLAF
jgi:hypothetical protein